MVDKELQTPTHFIEKNLDPNYCWNEWELRRKVIKKLINLGNLNGKYSKKTD